MSVKSLIINPGSTSTKIGVFEDAFEKQGHKEQPCHHRHVYIRDRGDGIKAIPWQADGQVCVGRRIYHIYSRIQMAPDPAAGGRTEQGKENKLSGEAQGHIPEEGQYSRIEKKNAVQAEGIHRYGKYARQILPPGRRQKQDSRQLERRQKKPICLCGTGMLLLFVGTVYMNAVPAYFVLSHRRYSL